MLIVSVVAHAQEGKAILDKSAAALKSAGNVKIAFTMQSDGVSQDGYIKLRGQKFVVNMGSTITWYDGKTMWNYVRQNEEVNVTTPSAAQAAKMNPYVFLTFYKKGYTVKKGTDTKKEHEVVLTGSETTPYKKVVMHINRSNYYPTRITLTSAKDITTTINCNSLQKNQKYNDATFRFNPKNYPNVEVVDLR